MAGKDYLAALNAEQRSAVEHGVTARGPNIAGRSSSSPEPDRARPTRLLIASPT